MKSEIEIERMQAELARLRAERDKLRQETIWYPLGVAAALITAIAVVLTGFLGLGILIGLWSRP